MGLIAADEKTQEINPDEKIYLPKRLRRSYSHQKARSASPSLERPSQHSDPDIKKLQIHRILNSIFHTIQKIPLNNSAKSVMKQSIDSIFGLLNDVNKEDYRKLDNYLCLLFAILNTIKLRKLVISEVTKENVLKKLDELSINIFKIKLSFIANSYHENTTNPTEEESKNSPEEIRCFYISNILINYILAEKYNQAFTIIPLLMQALEMTSPADVEHKLIPHIRKLRAKRKKDWQFLPINIVDVCVETFNNNINIHSSLEEIALTQYSIGMEIGHIWSNIVFDSDDAKKKIDENLIQFHLRTTPSLYICDRILAILSGLKSRIPEDTHHPKIQMLFTLLKKFDFCFILDGKQLSKAENKTKIELTLDQDLYTQIHTQYQRILQDPEILACLNEPRVSNCCSRPRSAQQYAALVKKFPALQAKLAQSKCSIVWLSLGMCLLCISGIGLILLKAAFIAIPFVSGPTALIICLLILGLGLMSIGVGIAPCVKSQFFSISTQPAYQPLQSTELTSQL